MAIEDFAPALAGVAGAVRRRPEITQQAIDNQLRRLIAEQGLAGQRQAIEQAGALFPSTLGAAQTAGRQAEANLARTTGLTPHEIETAQAVARRAGDPGFAASFTEEDVKARERGLRTAFDLYGTATRQEELRRQGEEFNVDLGLRGGAATARQNIGFEQGDPGLLGGSDFGVSLDQATIARVNAARERKERSGIRAEEFDEFVDPFRRGAIERADISGRREVLPEIIRSGEGAALLAILDLREAARLNPALLNQYRAALEAFETEYKRKVPEQFLGRPPAPPASDATPPAAPAAPGPAVAPTGLLREDSPPPAPDAISGIARNMVDDEDLAADPNLAAVVEMVEAALDPEHPGHQEALAMQADIDAALNDPSDPRHADAQAILDLAPRAREIVERRRPAERAIVEAAAAPPPAYTVRRGETLSAIARRAGTTVRAIVVLNPEITNPDRIREGQVIRLPGGR